MNNFKDKSFYKKPWFIILSAIVVMWFLFSFVIVGALFLFQNAEITVTENKSEKISNEDIILKEKEISNEINKNNQTSVDIDSKEITEEIKKKEKIKEVPIEVTVDELYTELDNNALKASDMYKSKYVEITGKLANIDSNGKSFSLRGDYEGRLFDSVYVSIPKGKREIVKEGLMNYSEGDIITVSGRIDSVGEFLGYSMDAEYVH